MENTFRNRLTQTTALVGVALLFTLPAAMAANITVLGPTNTTQVLGAGDSLTVTNTGSITATPDAQITGAAGNFVNNSGMLTGGTGIYLQSGADLSGGITNQAGGTITGSGIGILVRLNSDLSGGITNQTGGSISGGTSFGVAVNANSNIAGGIANQAGGVISGGIYGVLVSVNSDISGGIMNSGMLTGGTGIYLQSGADLSGGITNQAGGAISGGGTGIDVENGSDISGGIANQAGGSISGGNYGVVVQNASNISGGIANQAGSTISGGTYGIYVATNSNISGGITNSGAISGSFLGILVQSGGDISGGIANQAGGTISGAPGWYGVLVNVNSDISGGIRNSGSISGGNAGVRVSSNSDISGGITNQAGGTISGGSWGVSAGSASDISGGITNQAGGTISGGVGGIQLYDGDISGGIANSGAIDGSFAGVLLSSGSDIAGGIANSGTISGGNYGVFVNANSDISGGIANKVGGTISGANVGILVQTNSAISGGVTNQAGGLIEGATGILINASKISGGIINSGTIEGTGGTAISLNGLTGSTPITISGGQIIGDVVDDTPANGFSPVTVTGNFTSQGNLSVSSFGVSSGAAFTFGAGNTITSNSAVSDSGTIMISAAGSSITGGLSVNASGIVTAGDNFAVNGALTNAGTIAINNGKVLRATTFTGSAGSALDVQVGRSAGALTGGELVATGSAVDLTNTALDISVVAGSQPLVAGSTIVIANGNAAGVGPAAAVKDNSFLYNFSVAPTAGNNLTLTVSQAAITTSSNNANVAQVLLVDLANSTNPQINAIQNKLMSDTSNASFNHDLEATLPTVDGSAEVAALNVSSDSFNLIGDRLTELTEGRETGMAAGNGYESGFGSVEPAGGKDNDTSSIMQQAKPVQPARATSAEGRGQSQASEPAPDETWRGALRPATMWAEGFGQNSHQGERENIAGYHADTYGGAAGIDTRAIADHVIAGVAVSYGHTDASSKNANNTATAVDSYQLTLYGSYEPDGRTYIDGMAAYGWNRDNTTRHAVGGVTGLDAHGSYDANQVTAQAEAGREYTIGDTVLTPNLMVHAVWYDPASYTETGAGGADLHVNGNSQSLLEAGPGIKAGWVITDSSGGVVRPQLRAGYRYAVVDDKIEDTSQFTAGGGTFTTQGPSPARGSVDLGTSLRYSTPSNWNFTASYDFDWKSDYPSNAGFIRAGYRF